MLLPVPACSARGFPLLHVLTSPSFPLSLITAWFSSLMPRYVQWHLTWF